MPYSLDGLYPDKFQILSEDGERVLCRAWRLGVDGTRGSVLVVLPGAERPTRSRLDRLTHEFGLKDELDKAWAARPLELVRDGNRAMLVLEDPGGEPLDRLLGRPLETAQFLRIAIPLVVALRLAHEQASYTRTSNQQMFWLTSLAAGHGLHVSLLLRV
jgi:hypothetical protein